MNEIEKNNHLSNVAHKINEIIKQEFDCLLVTCGKCGGILNQLENQETSDGDITCPYCKYVGEPCDFPDLFY